MPTSPAMQSTSSRIKDSTSCSPAWIACCCSCQSAELRDLQAHFSTRGGHRSADVVAELEKRGFFHREGERETAPVSFMQPIEDFIEGPHSRSGLARAPGRSKGGGL